MRSPAFSSGLRRWAIACWSAGRAWPLAAALIVVCGGLATLVRLVPRVSRQPMIGLHTDQRGSVQSLSFVLTVPLFIMLMLLAVQITQLMIGLVVVHYAAFAAARS